jgi:murein tripeptide amidase MpaA
MSHALSPYLEPAALDDERARIVEKIGARATVYGQSVEGRPLHAVVVARAPADAPHVMLNANIHGPEWIGNRIAMRFLELLDDSERGRALCARAVVHVLPLLNPDGYARTFARAGIGRMRELRWNARGVDLNRNFPLPFGRAPSRWPGAGSQRVGDATYRGPDALSEPEASALAAYLDEHALHASASLHSFMGTLMIPPVLTRADAIAYATLGRAFQSGQSHDRYRTVMFPRLDVFTGELEDFQHHVHGTWAVCVEAFPLARSFSQHLRAPSIFWRMNPRDPTPVVDDVLGGLFAYFERALAMPRPARAERALLSP